MPDLSAAHAAMAKGLEARIAEAIGTIDPEALLKSWLPGGLKGFEAMQKAFWGRFWASRRRRTQGAEAEAGAG